MFGNLTTDGLEQTKDNVGGGFVWPTGIYGLTIKAMYAGRYGENNDGAHYIQFIGTRDDGKEYKQRIVITNKQGENFFHPKKKDGSRDTTKKVALPGFTIINEICIMATGQGLAQQTFEPKIFNVYDADAKAEVPKTVQMCVGVLGKPVKLGIQEVLKFKDVKDGNGNYVPGTEETTENDIDKVFHPTLHLTVPEGLAGKKTLEEAVFYGVWQKNNTNSDGTPKQRDARKKAGPGKPGAPAANGAPPVAGGAPGAAAPGASLFG